MKSNPFYALSAGAMLLGCWMLSRALHLQAGQLGGLLVLVAVLQLYEGLLVGLGSFLVRTGRAPRDGATVLVLESVFLVDATLLAAECVTADARVGTGVVAVLAALAAAKIGWVRRQSPGLLSRRAAALLFGHAVIVLALPAVAAHLAGARVFGPVALFVLWWTTLALPLARRALRGAILPGTGSGSARWLAAWTWTPAAMVMLHLWAVGYIHSIDFQPAFLAPLLIGLGLSARCDEAVTQVAAPAAAVIVSLGQDAVLGWHFLGVPALFVSPVRLAALGVGLAWAGLAWRDRQRWLAILAAAGTVAGLAGSSLSSALLLLERVLAPARSFLPRDAFGWGVLAVVAAFVLLVAGAWQSLGRPSDETGPTAPSRARLRGREWAAVSLALSVFADVAIFSGHRLESPGWSALVLGLAPFVAAGAAFAAGIRGRRRCAGEEPDRPGQRLASLAIVVSLLSLTTALAAPPPPPRPTSRSPLNTPLEEPRRRDGGPDLVASLDGPGVYRGRSYSRGSSYTPGAPPALGSSPS